MNYTVAFIVNAFLKLVHYPRVLRAVRPHMEQTCQ